MTTTTTDTPTRPTLLALAESLAPLLPDGPWTVEQRRGLHEDDPEPDWYANLTRERDGAGLHLQSGYRLTGRVRISGNWPRPFNGTHYHPHNGGHDITVSRDRTPKAIAAEIARRLLPAYLVAYAEAVRQREQHQADARTGAEAAETIRAALGLGPKAAREDHGLITFFPSLGSVYKVEVRPWSDAKRIKIDLESLTVDEALGVLRAVGAVRPASGTERPADCECDNTHEENGTCCGPCWAAGFRVAP